MPPESVVAKAKSSKPAPPVSDESSVAPPRAPSKGKAPALEIDDSDDEPAPLKKAASKPAAKPAKRKVVDSDDEDSTPAPAPTAVKKLAKAKPRKSSEVVRAVQSGDKSSPSRGSVASTSKTPAPATAKAKQQSASRSASTAPKAKTSAKRNKPAVKPILDDDDEAEVIQPASAEKPKPKKRKLGQPNKTANAWAAEFGPQTNLVRLATCRSR